ncbi:MAG: cobalamin-binding protein [Deltaproteobacteria bacterium]|nr:MAG: cobalamin-binding protein [Deltaproteobacteria bacterium]
MEVLQKISEELQRGNYQEVPKLIQQALDAKIPPAKILSEGLVAGMDIVGDKFRRDELFMPEVLISAKAMQAGMDVLRPKLIEAGAKLDGQIVVGTVKGDLHDIGKNLVAMLMEGAGFQVIDLGIDVPSEKFVEAVKTQKPDLLGLSALLTTTMPKMKEVIESLVEAGVRKSVKVVVGGAPVTEKFAKDIGADGYAPDAASAVEKARVLVG